MICAIVLAAGRSTRMGAQKLLLPFGGRTVIEHIVDEVGASPIEGIVVVTGADAPAVSDALSGRDVRTVNNRDPEAEMLSSVRCGLNEIPVECEAVLIVLGDQPSIQSDWIDQLVGAFRAGSRGIVVPVYEGHRGHPMLIDARYCREILTAHDDAGLRGFLDAHEDDVLRFPIDTSAVLEDMDYPADYLRELERARELRPA